MSLKSDKWIRKKALHEGMLEPFTNESVRKGVISYGLSSYGYDLRLSNEFCIFTNLYSRIVDPKNLDQHSFTRFKADDYVQPPNSVLLGRSIEYIRMPPSTLGICVGKSTYARCGLIVNVTPLEPQWEGFLTIEISNTNSVPVRIYPNEGIAQIVFLEADEVSDVSYASKGGKYQEQQGVTLPIIE